ncbi:hypothetical protein [Lysinibacillus sp. NPDC059133]|uniref:hypothetical protein n=1 Tax=Lysinibacillus sp. NPDC059133 TaxID=3346737 RepID=UPI00368CB625
MKKKIYFQIFIILIPLLSGIIWPLQDLFYSLLSVFNINTDALKSFIASISNNNKINSIILGGFLTGSLWVYFNIKNKESLLNTGNGYFDSSYFHYWIGSKILGYGKVTLIKVPIQLQYKLIINDTFREVLVDSNAREKEEDVEVSTLNLEVESNTINFILSDTYQTKIDEIPLEKRNLPTIIIERSSEYSGVRTFNPNFVNKIRNCSNSYSRQYKHINIFATTNTNHNKAIVEQCFKNGGRTGFERISVFDQKTELINNSRKYYFYKEHIIL